MLVPSKDSYFIFFKEFNLNLRLIYIKSRASKTHFFFFFFFIISSYLQIVRDFDTTLATFVVVP